MIFRKISLKACSAIYAVYFFRRSNGMSKEELKDERYDLLNSYFSPVWKNHKAPVTYSVILLPGTALLCISVLFLLLYLLWLFIHVAGFTTQGQALSVGKNLLIVMSALGSGGAYFQICGGLALYKETQAIKNKKDEFRVGELARPIDILFIAFVFMGGLMAAFLAP